MQEARKKDNLIVTLTFELALKVIEFSALLEERKKWALANQVFRCGVSVGANVREAQNAESKADFIHKLKIAAKEAEELQYYLELCNESSHLPDASELLQATLSVNRVLSKIISSSRTAQNQN